MQSRLSSHLLQLVWNTHDLDATERHREEKNHSLEERLGEGGHVREDRHGTDGPQHGGAGDDADHCASPPGHRYTAQDDGRDRVKRVAGTKAGIS